MVVHGSAWAQGRCSKDSSIQQNDPCLIGRGWRLFYKSSQTVHITLFCVVVQNGHVVSPLIRVLTSSGDWIWMTAEVTLRYKSGTNIPQFVEFKARVLR